MTQELFTQRLLWLLNISRTMLMTRDVQRLLTIITDACIELTEAERGYLLLKSPVGDQLLAHAGRGRGATPAAAAEARIIAVAERVIKENRALLLTDTAATEDPAARRSSDDAPQKMVVCLPLVAGHETLGALYAEGPSSPDQVFAANTRRSLEILAEHAAGAIENARLFQRATNDPLTGLPNNSFYLLQLTKALRDATTAAPGGILLLDLDNFKRVNLAAGAGAGDRALIDVATTLQDVLRADGLVARYGSDKFGILLPPEEGTWVGLRLRDVAERARAAVRTKTFHGVQLSACIGGIAFPLSDKKEATPADLMAVADDVLARARARGPGEVEVESPASPAPRA